MVLWHFVDLSDAQKQRRRELLDLYAYIAEASVFVPILALQLFFLIAWIHDKSTRHDDLSSIPSSPYRKESRLRKFAFLVRAQKNIRRFNWWAGEPIEIYGSLVATRGEFLGAAGWAAWLLLLCVLQTGDDYLHLTKRFGIIAASQLPLQYLLSRKSPFSYLQILTRMSWESLNRLHQLLGRITIILIYLHAAFYLNFYVLSGLLSVKLGSRVVILGLIGTIAFTAVGTTALSWLRRLNYRIFYITHVVLATILLPVLFFHVAHIRLFIWETIFVYAFNDMLRYIGTTTHPATIIRINGTDMLDISIAVPPAPSAPTSIISRVYKHFFSKSDYQPGQHAYISLVSSPKPSQSSFTAFRQNVMHPLSANPFTVASVPSSDGKIRLVARIRDGNTARLARAARDASGPSNRSSASLNLRLEGPYGLPTHPSQLLHYNRVLFVAGGVGATFILPIYRTLLKDLSPSAGSARRARVRFVWAVRGAEDVRWAVDNNDNNSAATSEQEAEMRGVKERMEVWITGPSSNTGSGYDSGAYDQPDLSNGSVDEVGTADKAFVIQDSDDEDDIAEQDQPDGDMGTLADNDTEGVEMQRLLPQDSSSNGQLVQQTSNKTAHNKGQGDVLAGLTTHTGRPDLAEIVRQTFAHASSEKVAVFICGPVGMTRLLRKEVGRYVREGREVWFWKEGFGL